MEKINSATMMEDVNLKVIQDKDIVHIRTKKGTVSIQKDDLLFPIDDVVVPKLLDQIFNFKNSRLNQIGKMLLLMVSVLYCALAFNNLADALVVETSYLHPLIVAVPTCAWIWFYVKKLW